MKKKIISHRKHPIPAPILSSGGFSIPEEYFSIEHLILLFIDLAAM